MQSITLIDNGVKAEDFVRLRVKAGFLQTPIEQARKAIRNSLFHVAVKEKESFYERFGFVSVPNEMTGAGMKKYVQL